MIHTRLPDWGATPSYARTLIKKMCLPNATWFAHFESYKRGWEDEAMQQDVCNAVLGRTDGDRTIRDTVVISHSLGNLAFAGAVASGAHCTFDNSTSRWYTISPPWQGSKAADWISNLCKNPSGFNKAIGWLAAKLGYCNGTDVSAVYKSMQTSVPRLKSGELKQVRLVFNVQSPPSPSTATHHILSRTQHNST